MKTTPQDPKNSLAGNVVALTCLCAVFGLSGCEKEGSAEKTGKVERTTESTAPRAGRPAQKMEGAQQQMPSTAQPASPGSESAGEYIDDAAITTKVKAALLNDPMLSASRIEVTTDKGVVKLSGTVDSEPGINRALELAGAQSGVKSVQTDLSVTTAPGK
ncbi:BON domain-containing protein [Methylobacter sp.]|uniref:BON domain-containing protein n=1 Tax=Methylobacter sp. TaxID=2051955 RepID=UPI001212266D|nr:BON domain-containing protein [Methylobacter sp.]TAK64440.1 MAG: BON domain-containing protein [Methylobacter sp.]